MKKELNDFLGSISLISNNINCERHMQYISTVEKYLKYNGWRITENFNSEKYIIFGCGGFDGMYERIARIIEMLKEKYVLKKNIIIMGCITKTHEEKIREIFNGLIIGYHEEEMLDRYLNVKVPFRMVTPNNLVKPHRDCSIESKERDFFYIKIAEGCRRKCTFCIINKVKGYIKSITRDEIEKQFKIAIQGNYKKIFLMGEDTFAYGIDIGTNIIELLEYLLAIDHNVRFYFGSLHLDWVEKYSKQLLSLCKKGVIKELFIGMQHVNDDILKKMGRPIQFSKVYDIMCSIKRECPDLYLGVDIIVGFPGETKEIFQELVRFFKKDKCINTVYHNGFCDFESTPSFKLNNKNTPAEIVFRWKYFKDEVLGDRSPYNRTSDSREEDIALRLSHEKDYFFCSDMFNDKMEKTLCSGRLLVSKSITPLKQPINFNFED